MKNTECFGEREKTIHLEEVIIMKNAKKLIPGAAIALVIAVAAKFLESLEESAGLHFIGASVIAMFIGMIVNALYKPNSVTAPGIKFTSKKILKFAIILLGASLNIRTVLTVGRFSLTVMVFTLATCFGLGALIGKALGLNWKTSSLINAGTGICGGSAIAAIAPVIEATDMDIAYGLSATFLFDTVMIVVFPILGHWMGLSDAAFGLWAGTAVNDTSSVVATGDFATMVKLTRTLAIIPAVLAFAAINVHLKRKAQAAEGTAVKVSIKSIFPWFILGFLAMSALTSLGLIPAGTAAALKTISKFLMVAALAAIGLNTDFKSLCRKADAARIHHFAAGSPGSDCSRICDRHCAAWGTVKKQRIKNPGIRIGCLDFLNQNGFVVSFKNVFKTCSTPFSQYGGQVCFTEAMTSARALGTA